MLRIAVCDDELSFLSQLHSILSAWQPNSSRFCIESFDNGDALLSSHAESHFAIILLDVVMPLLNGIDTAKELRKKDKNVKIIFLNRGTL